MKRVLFTAAFAAMTWIGAPAAAEDIQDVLVGQLTEQGFTRIQIGRTFLGRVRIVATSPDYSREIIFNPRTGEILRDYWDDVDDQDEGGFAGRISSPNGSASRSSSNDDDDNRRTTSSSNSNDDDDEKDDDKEDDKDDDKDDDKEDDKDNGDDD